MKEFQYVVKDPLGIHARPAGLLVKEAKNGRSEIVIEFGGKSADAKRLLAVMSLGVKSGNEVTVRVEGPDEDSRAEELKAFFEANF